MMPWYTIPTLAVTALMSLLMIYQVLIGIFAFKSLKRPGPADRLHRFALVIAARNEENVIGCLIDSLLAQNYPRDAYDLFVIADNCTDQTGAIAAAKGARVFYRQDTVKVSKGYALGWFFQRFLAEYADHYDAVGIFDADNLVDPNYLAEMNRQLCAGDVAIMGYRDSKNAADSIIATTLAMSFWMIARFYEHPRQILGLMTTVSGTGYVFHTRLIADGWDPRTICEDMEFTVKMAVAGHRIGYSPYALFYDEQPVRLLPSLRQRFRWAVGIYQNVRINLPVLLRRISGKNWTLVLDTIIALLIQPGFGLQMLITMIGLGAAFLAQPVQAWGVLLQPLLLSSLIGLVLMLLQSFLIVLVARKFSWKILPGILCFPLYLISNAVIFMVALFVRQTKWHPIVHERAINLSQIDP